MVNRLILACVNELLCLTQQEEGSYNAMLPSRKIESELYCHVLLYS